LGRDSRRDSGGHGQCLLRSDLRMQVQGDSCGDLQFEKEGDPQADCRGDSQSDSDRDLQRDSGGESRGYLRSDFHDPFAEMREERGERREESACKFISGLTLGNGESKRLFSCALRIGVYNNLDFQRGLSIVQS
jgi:hypothetical protein